MAPAIGSSLRSPSWRRNEQARGVRHHNLEVELQAPAPLAAGAAGHRTAGADGAHGINGVGKTHLLQAIKEGAVAVEGMSTSEILYFDWTSMYKLKLEQGRPGARK